MQESNSADPWLTATESTTCNTDNENNFEDSFIDFSTPADLNSVSSNKEDLEKLPDSEQYLARLRKYMHFFTCKSKKFDHNTDLRASYFIKFNSSDVLFVPHVLNFLTILDF